MPVAVPAKREGMVSEPFELHISDVSEIEAVELQNAIEERAKVPYPVELSTEALPNASSSGDPGLAAALLTYAPQVVPVLASAVAAWLVAGRKKVGIQPPPGDHTQRHRLRRCEGERHGAGGVRQAS